MKKIAVVLALFSVLTACGGSGGAGRPSTDEIARALKDKDNPIGKSIAAAGGTATDEAIQCISKAFHDSKVSDAALTAIITGDTGYKGSKKDADRFEEVISNDFSKCLLG
jgi:hypothetical protein